MSNEIEEAGPAPAQVEPEAIDAQKGVLQIAALMDLPIEGVTGLAVKLDADLNVTATRLGEVAQRLPIFRINGELVCFLRDGERVEVTPRFFRTWINSHLTIAAKFDKEDGKPIPGTLKTDDAGAILESESFLAGVRKIAAVNRVRLPVVRKSGALEKLPWGYDDETKIYTVPGGLDYATDVSLESAKVGMGRVDGEFPFENQRSIAVQRAANLALFCKHLPGGDGLRPGFLWLGNRVGCGKSVLAKSILYPVIGSAAAAKLKQKEDLDKELEAFMRAGVPYIFLDNVYGGLASASLDQLLTSKKSTGRALGGHSIFEVDNTALVVVTGNRLELNEDAARRFVVVDLFDREEPGTRQIECRLDDDAMLSEQWRGEQLARLWAMVAHWHAMGMPRAQVLLAGYERYSEMLGGIVTAAGYEEPFQTALIPDSISPENAEFLELVELILQDMGAEDEKKFVLEDLVRMARGAELFQDKIGSVQDGVDLVVKRDGIAKGERGFVRDEGLVTASHRASFTKWIKKRMGCHVGREGQRVEFGRREEAKKMRFSVKRLRV